MEEFFDTRALGYEAHMAQYPDAAYWWTVLEAQLPRTDSTTRILDLGCGPGLELDYIVRRQPHAQITCIDVSERMLAQLRLNHASLLSQLDLIKGSYFEQNWPERYFDHAVACETMHHWLFSAKLNLYEAIRRALKDGGTFIDYDYFVRSEEEKKLAGEYSELAESGQIRKDRSYHIDIPFTVVREMEVLKAAGFRQVRLIEERCSSESSAGMIVAEK
ncbi:MAG TPA: class I SAM-dependent methyltransferase [Thermodesulfobacteriota bacterium]|nr:class I SAM-dependent methyltransferase [Thermodesulfobacteriota bacterium]